MLFRRLHLQLTGLCAGITITILSVFTIAYLSVAEHTMLENRALTFQDLYDTLSSSLRQQPILTQPYLLRMEQNNDCLIFLWDNGSPLSFNRLETHSTYAPLAASLYQKYYEQTAEGVLREDILFASSGELGSEYLSDAVPWQDIYMGISNISTSGMSASEKIAALQKNRGLVLLVLSPNASLRGRLVRQRVMFGLLALAGCLLLTLFSYIFTGKMLKPLRENQEKQLAFIAGASHELRTPLAVILSAVDARPPHFEETVKSESLRMGRLVDELLLLSRLDGQTDTPGRRSGTLTMQSAFRFELLEPDTFLLDLYEQMEGYAVSKGRQLTLDIPDQSIPKIYADVEKLRQLLEILIENAVSYTADGGQICLKLSYECKCSEQSSRAQSGAPNGYRLLFGKKRRRETVCFIVADNGVGIPDPEKEKIFERFYRAENSRTSKEHFGLGLCIAKEIVEAHKGRITVSDTPDGGSAFHCFFPINKP